LVWPRLGTTFGLSQATDDRLAKVAGRGFIANIDVAIAHDENPLLLDHNAQLPIKVATPFDWVDRWGSSVHRQSGCLALLHQRKVKKSPGANPYAPFGFMTALLVALAAVGR
jgi:hypothetical protein